MSAMTAQCLTRDQHTIADFQNGLCKGRNKNETDFHPFGVALGGTVCTRTHLTTPPLQSCCVQVWVTNSLHKIKDSWKNIH